MPVTIKAIKKKKPASEKIGNSESVTTLLKSLKPHPEGPLEVTFKQVRSMHVIAPRHKMSIASRKQGRKYLVWRLQ
jgi:hypothetical protein